MLQFLFTVLTVTLFLQAGKFWERKDGFSPNYVLVLVFGAVSLAITLSAARQGI